MKKTNSIFIPTEQCFNVKELKSYDLKKEFNCSTNSIVSFINRFKGIKELTFIFEKKCSHESIFLYSQLFLTSIISTFPELITIKDFQIYLGDQPISTNHHLYTKRSSIFSHSIIIRKGKHHLSVAHLNITPQDFAINISNMFCHQINNIQNKLK